jgi:hypothetical protein
VNNKELDVAQKDRFAVLQHSEFLPVPQSSVRISMSANPSAAPAERPDH